MTTILISLAAFLSITYAAWIAVKARDARRARRKIAAIIEKVERENA